MVEVKTTEKLPSGIDYYPPNYRGSRLIEVKATEKSPSGIDNRPPNIYM